MASKVELLKTKVQESKNDFEILKKSQKDNLEKDKVKEKYEKIKEIKKELQELKQETLNSTDPAVQKEISELETEINLLESDFNKEFNAQLDELKTEVESTKPEATKEKKSRIREQRDGVTSKEEWKEHTLRNVGRVAMGVGAVSLAWKGIKRLFGIGKEKKEEKSESSEGDKKEEKKPRWKKALLRGGGILGGLAIWKNRDKISGWFGGLFSGKNEDPENGLSTPNNSPSSYNNLPQESKEKYNSTSDEIDTFTTSNIDLATVVEFPENDKINKSNILFGLDKHSENLQDFYTNDTLDYISGQTTDSIIDNIKNRSKEKMHEFLYPFLSGLESFKPFGTEFISKPAEQLDKWLEGGESENRKAQLVLFYKQYMNIINYSVEKKKLLEEKLAKAEVMGDIRINENPTEKEQNAIDDLLSNDKRRKGKLESFFKRHKLMDLPNLCKKYGIEINELSEDTKELLQKLEEEKDDILQKDDNGQTCISKAEADISDGNLEKETIKDLDKTCKKLLDIEFGDNSKSLFGAYTHLVTDIFSDNKDLADSFMEKTGLKELSVEFKSNLEGYRARLDAGTFSPQDLQDLKSQTESYLNAKKQYEISMKNIDYMSDGFNISIGKILNIPLEAAKDIGKGLGKGKTNSRRERVGYGLGGCYVVGQTLYISSTLMPGNTLLWRGAKMLTYGTGKLGIAIGKAPITIAENGLKLLTGRSHLTSLAWTRYIKNAPHLGIVEKEALLKYAFLNGEITERGTLNVAKNLNLSSGNGSLLSIDNLIQKRGGGKFNTPEKIATLKKYISNKNLRQLLIIEKNNQSLSAMDNIKYSLKDRALKLELDINNVNLSKIHDIDVRISGLDGTNQKVLNTMMKYTKDIDNATYLATIGVDSKYLKYIESGVDKLISAEKFGEYLGKYGGEVDDLGNFLKFIDESKSANKIIYSESFIKNGLKNWSKIKDAPNQLQLIDDLNLNKSGSIIEKFSGKVGEAWIKAKNMFSEGLNRLKNLFSKNPKISPEMNASIESNLAKQEAKLADVTEDVLNNPATKENANLLKSIFSNPIFKRILTVVPLLLDVAFTVFRAINDFKEVEEIKKTNKERSEVRENETYFNIGLGGISATIATLGVANVRNPGGRVILGITAGIETVRYASRKYYEVINTYYRNFEDFRRMCMAHIKQELISKEAWSNGIDINIQERFQEVVSRFFGDLYGKEKKVLSLRTREEAIKALIWMEECENYPYSTLSLDNFAGVDQESINIQKEINVQKDAMQKDSNIRYEYLTNTYNDKFISSNKLDTNKGKEELDRILMESRQYLAMTKDNKKSSSNIAEYQSEVLLNLKENPSFEKLEKIYNTSPIQLHKIIKSLPYFGFMFKQLDETTYQNYSTIKTNMDYIVKYYNHKTFGLLPSDIPNIQIDGDQVDYKMIENFFLTFDIAPTGFSKEELISGFENNQLEIMTEPALERTNNISTSIGQNILYRIAKEVLGGYAGKNNLDDLKMYYSPDQKNHNGIYYEDGKWKLNQHSNRYSMAIIPNHILLNIIGIGSADKDKSFAKDETLNDMKNISMLSQIVNLFSQGGGYISGHLIDLETETAESKINKEYGNMINNVITEEIEYRKPENIAKYKSEAIEYIKNNSNGKYIPLSVDLIYKLTKSGIENVGYYYYIYDGSNVKAIQGVSGAIPQVLSDKKCGLVENIETYEVREIEYTSETKKQISEIDERISNIATMVSVDGNDINLHEDIQKMLKSKTNEWNELKIQLNHANQDISSTILAEKYQYFQSFFENLYIMILHCSANGASSNDVNDYTDYLTISNYLNTELVKITKESGSSKVEVNISGFDYNKEFNNTIATYEIPGIKKTVSTLLYSTNPDDVELGRKFAKAILKSILESAMLKYDIDGKDIQGLCNKGARQVNEKLLEKRLKGNIEEILNQIQK